MADPSGLAAMADSYMDKLNQLPPDVRQYILTHPFYMEGQGFGTGWPTPYAGQDQEARSYWQGPKTRVPSQPTPRRAQDISYQQGANAMPGMPWDDPSAGAGAMAGWTPQQKLMWQLLMNRGAGGMQPNPNTNNLVNQLQGGGQQGPMGLSPQMMAMLQYYMQNQANNLGPQQGSGMQGPVYPQGGGGVDLGAMMQALGFPR